MAGVDTSSASPSHLAYRSALIQAIQEHGAVLQPHELLAITAYMMGQFIAFQHQRTMTPQQATKILNENIQQGNTEAISALMGAPKGTA